jgi:DNA-binding transcriptional LysR family regulator
MKRSDLNLLYALDAFSRTGSVKAAAEMLNLSAPAMSHMLARLRDATGDPLLVKAGRKLVPTPHALAIIEETREVVARAQAVLAPAVDDERWSLASREFAVVAPDELTITFGVRLLSAITEKMPNATLTLLPSASTSTDRLRLGTVDVEVSAAGKLPPELKVEVLRKHQTVVVMHHSHELAQQKMTLTRYIKAKHVCQSTNHALDMLVEQALVGARVSRRAVLRVATPYAALAAASRSDLIATSQDALFQSVAKDLGLVSMPFPLKVEQFIVRQIWHPRGDKDPQQIWLRTCIKAVLGAGKVRNLSAAKP